MTFLRRLARIVIRPRTTMREILDTPPDRMILPLVLLGIASGLLRGFNARSFPGLDAKTWLIVCAAMLGVIACMVLLFYAFAWLAFFIGRLLDGTGDPAAARSALAWGTAPLIWALLYRLPAAFLAPIANPARLAIQGRDIKLDAGMFGDGCFAAMLFAIIELAVLAWYLVIASQTLAEAHRFEAWRGFATLAIIAATPVLVMIAAFLSLR